MLSEQLPFPVNCMYDFQSSSNVGIAFHRQVSPDVFYVMIQTTSYWLLVDQPGQLAHRLMVVGFHAEISGSFPEFPLP